MTVWDQINAPMAFVAVILMSYELLKFGDRLILPERLGMGLVGSGFFLYIARTIAPENTTPFDGWSQSLTIYGVVIYVTGRCVRHARHDRANRKQRQIADDYLRGREKV